MYNTYKLQELCKHIHRGCYKSIHDKHKIDSKTSNYRHVTIKDTDSEIIDVYYCQPCIKDIMDSYSMNLAAYTVHDKDVVIRRSYPYKASIVRNNGMTAIVDGNLFICHGIDYGKIMPEYLSFALNSRSVLESIRKACNGKSFISASALRNIEIKVPPLDEQQEFVERLNGFLMIVAEAKSEYAKALNEI